MGDPGGLKDVFMPDVDGIELLKHIRTDASFCSIPVVSMPCACIAATWWSIRAWAFDRTGCFVTCLGPYGLGEGICQYCWRKGVRSGGGPFFEKHLDPTSWAFMWTCHIGPKEDSGKWGRSLGYLCMVIDSRDFCFFQNLAALRCGVPAITELTIYRALVARDKTY